MLQLRRAGIKNGGHAPPKGEAILSSIHLVSQCNVCKTVCESFNHHRFFRSFIWVYDRHRYSSTTPSLGTPPPTSGGKLTLQRTTAVRHAATSRRPAGDALQKFIFSFDGRDSPALSKTALTAYAVLVFIGSIVMRLAVVAQSPYVSAVPLCFLKTLEKLGFTSALSLVPLVYLLIFQVSMQRTLPLLPSTRCHAHQHFRVTNPSLSSSPQLRLCIFRPTVLRPQAATLPVLVAAMASSSACQL